MEKRITKQAMVYGLAAIILASVFGTLVYQFGGTAIFHPSLAPTSAAVSMFSTFSSYDDVKTFIQTNSKAQSLPYYVDSFGLGPSLSFRGPSALSEGSSGPSYSTTNVQVAGVDELDKVKNDGQFAYIASGNTVYIIRAYPARSTEILSRITFDDETPIGIYVNNDNLVVIAANYVQSYNYYVVRNYFYAPSAVNQMLSLRVYDITNRSNPVQTRYFTITGSYFNSRMLGNYVYFIASQPAYIVQNTTVTLPEICSNQYKWAIAPSEIRYLNESGVQNYYEFTTFVAVNVIDSSEGPAYLTLMLGSTSTLYVSYENMYITSPSYQTLYMNDLAQNIYTSVTDIYRIKIDGANLTAEAKGTVEGHELNQFSMDEYNGYFRIVTNDYFNGAQQTRLYVLDRTNMNIAGRLFNLGTNEDLHSVRFAGARAYVVTFKKTDPLFVIDLSDPNTPTVLGELVMPGYSDYLHPYDENHLIGVGKDTEDAGSFAWYLGIKVSLFDVTDVANPVQMSTFVIGDRGSDSEVLTEHKAFLFDKAKNLLVIPVQVANISEAAKSDIDSRMMPFYGSLVYQGVYVFNVSLSDGIALKGRITHGTEIGLPPPELWIHRSFYIDDLLYTVSNEKVKVNNLQDLAQIAEIILN